MVMLVKQPSHLRFINIFSDDPILELFLTHPTQPTFNLSIIMRDGTVRMKENGGEKAHSKTNGCEPAVTPAKRMDPNRQIDDARRLRTTGTWGVCKSSTTVQSQAYKPTEQSSTDKHAAV